MRVDILGCSGAEFPGFNLPSFLIDGKLLVDAGTIGSKLSGDRQWKIRHIIISHAHLDHVRGIPFLADNIIIKNKRHSVTVIGITPVLAAIKSNLLNNRLWPDFTAIPDKKRPALRFLEITAGKPVKVGGYEVTAYRVDHTVPAVGYIIENKKGKRILYTGDTGPTNMIWKAAGKKKIDAAIIEVSFPDAMREMALKIGHLTPALLKEEIGKMRIIPDRILVTHPKPQHIEVITAEIRKLKMPNIRILRDGEVINI